MSNPATESALLSIRPTDFALFRSLIHKHAGIWVRDGKQTMLASRLARRLRVHGMSDFGEYYRFVANCGDGDEELAALINCVTTNKTAFFRENHHFEFLSNVVVPESVARTDIAPASGNSTNVSFQNKTVRVWSAACSTGEEPYSIAITLLEAKQRLRGAASGALDIHVVASDIDTDVLGKAARGVYNQEELEDIDPTLHKKYFLRGKDDMSGQFKVKSHVASLVNFQRINLMDRSWPVSGPFDAIFFRNALIYFQQDIQDVFLRRMVRYLKPGGYLFLGHSEHIPWLHSILEPLHQTVFRLRGEE